MKINKKELHSIFIKIRKHDETEFSKLYEEYKTLLYGVAFSILKNKEDSEEIVQTVFMKIFNLPQDKLPTENEASWLYTLTKNESISFLRKRREYLNVEEIYEIEDECKEINYTIDKMRYNQLIRKLSNTEKEIVSLKILSGYSFNEIAKFLNKPVGTVKWRYYKAVDTLKIMLSNLAMFIFTFVIGLNTIKKQNKQLIQEENNENKEEQTNNIKDEQQSTNTDREIQQDETKKEDTSNAFKNEQETSETKKEQETTFENSMEDTMNEIKQESIVQESQENINQYIGIGMISISSIFLILTIIFSIFLVKNKLKNHFKSSK